MDLRERPPEGSERHPWERARTRFFAGVIREAISVHGRPKLWLDAGAGDAFFTKTVGQHLTPQGSPSTQTTAFCWDANYSDSHLAELSQQAPTWMQFVRDLPVHQFDLITALDVAEHIEDDDAFLHQLRSRLCPEGLLLISVPAWPQLFTLHDHQLKHFRRYLPSGLRELLKRTGFSLLSGGGLFHGLLTVRAIEKMVEQVFDQIPNRSRPYDEPIEEPVLRWNAPSWATRFVDRALHYDNRLSYWAAKRNLHL
ncbi:MAG: methyltransferase domain-containing protein, partial [Myxococcota bacterium]